jgi:hypothetical protein
VGEEVCVRSNYLELVSSKRVLLCSHSEALFLHSLLPSEDVLVSLSPEWLEFKRHLWLFEFFLCRSHLRVHSLEKVDSKTLGFIRELESKYVDIFKDHIPLEGPAHDFFR